MPSSETNATGGAVPGGSIGSVAPAFALPDLEGRIVESGSFAGRVVILNFWATWCAPCRKEIPEFRQLQAKLRAQGLSIVGLSLDFGGASEVRPFVEEHDVNYTMLIANDETAESFGGVIGLPTTFVLDRQGRIVRRFIGYTAPEVFEEVVRPLLAAS